MNSKITMMASNSKNCQDQEMEIKCHLIEILLNISFQNHRVWAIPRIKALQCFPFNGILRFLQIGIFPSALFT